MISLARSAAVAEGAVRMLRSAFSLTMIPPEVCLGKRSPTGGSIYIVYCYVFAQTQQGHMHCIPKKYLLHVGPGSRATLLAAEKHDATVADMGTKLPQ